ncbi:hypothetical protein ABZV59_22230 [Streptomyces anthocyanicus]|uniref:hypothetical protein n=1 Tax=Streptomyces anthocyanicus TaxID=68174 RepID=UPI00339F8826
MTKQLALLRLPHLIRAWQPGATAAVVEVPTKNNEKSLRRVVGNDAFDVTSHLAATDPWAKKHKQ